MLFKIRLCELSLTQPYEISVCAKSLALMMGGFPKGEVFYGVVSKIAVAFTCSLTQLILNTILMLQNALKEIAGFH